MADTQVTKSSLLPWDVGAAAVNLTDEYLEAQEEQVTCSQRHIAGKWQGQGCGLMALGHTDGAAQAPLQCVFNTSCPFQVTSGEQQE